MNTEVNTEVNTEETEAGSQYAAAYAAHYAGRNLPLALRQYMKLLASHATSPEAGYAWMQIQNIVNAVVPRQELLAAQMKLALTYRQHDTSCDHG